MDVRKATKRSRWALVGTVAALTARNVGSPWLPAAGYVLINLALGAGLVVLARWSGTRCGELGSDRRRLGAGLRLGALGGGAAAAVMAVGALLPVTRVLLAEN